MKHPLLYQINTRILLQERGVVLGRHATLDDVPNELLDHIAAEGFDLVWFLGVWQTGEIGVEISRTQPSLRSACQHCLPDMTDKDICGSPFAIQAYTVNRDFGDDAALARLRRRLGERELRLVLDFVPNHVAPDHPWVKSNPEYFIEGTEEDLRREPRNYLRLQTPRGEKIMAYGRDPYFDGWSDTLQLNYRHPGTRAAMLGEILRVAERCDGVRCDMAMLVQPAIFMRTWGDRALPRDGAAPEDVPFWPRAIGEARRKHPGFLFIAEVYWDMEFELQNAGFDFTYDKRLYDRLVAGAARPVREHLMAHPEFQNHSLRFLENHDEPRSAAVFGPKLRAAAIITFLIPGMRFMYEGQFEGRKTHVSMHIGRRPMEEVDESLATFYERLIGILHRHEAHDGKWELLSCRQAWDGNHTWDQFVALSWKENDHWLLAVVNYGPSQAQCYVTLDSFGTSGHSYTLLDLIGDTSYEREGDNMARNGLYVDLPPWGFNVFDMQDHKTAPREHGRAKKHKRERAHQHA